ncbi:hypothetical protein NDU88_004677 [Pleurodeles waltl]|uniref:Uncharacterized protein n=1 Tax=Pleurodeles waltl TaxID=8319 RepID=A0AAV7RIS5_PLEWA|nr:hypothetical protein NDU88_004677 [Pleurodeles waltl]
MLNSNLKLVLLALMGAVVCVLLHRESLFALKRTGGAFRKFVLDDKLRGRSQDGAVVGRVLRGSDTASRKRDPTCSNCPSRTACEEEKGPCTTRSPSILRGRPRNGERPLEKERGKDRLGLSKTARRGRRERSGESREWGCWRSRRLVPETPAEMPPLGTELEGGSKAPERSQKQRRARSRYRLRQRGGREAKLIADPNAWGLGHPPRRPQRERDWREARRPLSAPQQPGGEITKAGPGKTQIPAPAVVRKRGEVNLCLGTEADPGTGE